MTTETLNVLLISEDPDIMDLLQQELVGTFYDKIELECSEHLAKGLEWLEGDNFDVVLLDLSLPDYQGLDTFEKVRECAPEIPIIILANFEDDNLAIKAIQQGAQDYLIKKGIDRILLLRSIRYAIERQGKLYEFKTDQSNKLNSGSKFWKYINPFNGKQRKDELEDIHSYKQFQVLIERERSQVDRSGLNFSLVVFEMENIDNDKFTVEDMVQVLRSRKLRLADEVGWFGKKNIGVLMHNTNSDEAWNFSNTIREIIAATGSPPDCNVYTYPSENWGSLTGLSLKRKNERFNIKTKTIVHVRDEDLTELKSEFLATNISKGGLFLKTHHPLSTGSELEINLVIPTSRLKKLIENKALIKVSGTVVRTDSDGLAICFDKEYDIVSLISESPIP